MLVVAIVCFVAGTLHRLAHAETAYIQRETCPCDCGPIVSIFIILAGLTDFL